MFRLVARDTEVAIRLAQDVKCAGCRAIVVAGDHEYGIQLDDQLRLGDLPRADDVEDAALVVLCGLANQPEIERVRSLAPLPVIAFDGAQGADLGSGRDVLIVALPFAPSADFSTPISSRASVRLDMLPSSWSGRSLPVPAIAPRSSSSYGHLATSMNTAIPGTPTYGSGERTKCGNSPRIDRSPLSLDQPYGDRRSGHIPD